MNQIIDLIKEFEGIIGTLLGVIITLVLTQILKNIGKIKFFVLDKKIIYRVEDNRTGNITFVESGKDYAKSATIEVSFEIYNNSEVPKILRKIKINYYENKKKLLSHIPDDKSTGKVYDSIFTFYDDMTHLNIYPKQIHIVHLKDVIDEDELEQFKKCNKIMFEMENHRGKKYKVYIGEI